MTSGLRGFRPTAEKQRALQVRQAFDKTCADIRFDPDLSATGKVKAMTAAWFQCKATLDEIRATETDAIAARRSFLEGQLFGRG